MRTRSMTAVAALAILSGSASADTFGFFGQSQQSQQNTGTGEEQLVVDVFETGISIQEWIGTSDLTVTDPRLGTATLVDFVFSNVGASNSVVTGIYFSDPDLLKVFSFFGNSLIEGPGVDFDVPADPNALEDVVLPGGGSPAPAGFDTAFSTGAVDPDELVNGINQGEQLTIRLALLDGLTLEDLIQRIEDKTLQFGLLVKGFEDGGIETFVNFPTPVAIPAPLGVAMGALGLGALASRRRR